jgi:hypothetical protein
VSPQHRIERIGHRLDGLADAGVPRTKSRVRRHLAVIREKQSAAGAAVRAASVRGYEAIADYADELDYRLRLLEIEVDVAEASLASEDARDAEAFRDALAEEVEAWDEYLELLQVRAARKSGRARAEAEEAIRVMRNRRNALASCLDRIQASANGSLRELKRVAASARIDLDEAVDESASKFD